MIVDYPEVRTFEQSISYSRPYSYEVIQAVLVIGLRHSEIDSSISAFINEFGHYSRYEFDEDV